MKRIQLDMTDDKVTSIEEMMEAFNIKTKKDFFNLTLSTMQWMLRELNNGRIIASVDEDHGTYKELMLPITINVQNCKPIGLSVIGKKDNQKRNNDSRKAGAC